MPRISRCFMACASATILAGALALAGSGSGQGQSSGQGQGSGQTQGSEQSQIQTQTGSPSGNQQNNSETNGNKPDAPPGKAKGLDGPVYEIAGNITDVLVQECGAYPVVEITTDEGRLYLVRLAPVWFLKEELGLTIEADSSKSLPGWLGQEVNALIQESLLSDQPTYHAIWIDFTSTPDLTPDYRFRTDDGMPLWMSRRNGPEARENAIDPAAIREMSGVVTAIGASLVTGDLKVVMRGDDGLFYGFHLGSPDELAGLGLTIREQNRLTVRYAPDPESKARLALEFSNEAQVRVRLRDANGNRIAASIL